MSPSDTGGMLLAANLARRQWANQEMLTHRKRDVHHQRDAKNI